MPGQRRAIRGQVQASWARGGRGSVVLVALVALAVLAVALTLGFALLGGGDARKPQRALSTTLANQQLAGLADPGPAAGTAVGTAAGTAQRLLAPAAAGLAFAAGGGDGTVLASQQWQADQMTDGSYVLVYVPNGKCLDAAAAQGAAHPAAQLALTTCDLRSSQRWQHPYLGKDPTGRDYWLLRSQSTARCVTASGAQWRDGTPAQLEPCGKSFGWQQLIEFWSAY
jgi:Ricin-type beta-trefoil lectin domain-like